MNTTRWHWVVIFRNDTMGFAKRFEVVAGDLQEALKEAEASLREKAYDPGNFQVTLVDRVREVGT